MLAGGSGVQAAFSWLKSRTTTRPPRFAAAVIERTAVAGSASHWSTRAAVTMSNAVSNGSAPASATSNDRPGTPPWAARAFSIIAALTSTPTARPSRPTASAMPRVIAPVPHPTSSTARPGLSSAASRR